MNRARLEATLRETFEPTPGALRVVVRQATDLAESGEYERDTGRSLTPEELCTHLQDAPDGVPGESVEDATGPTLVDRWNWWVGSLELAYGGYAEFQVRRWREG